MKRFLAHKQIIELCYVFLQEKRKNIIYETTNKEY